MRNKKKVNFVCHRYINKLTNVMFPYNIPCLSLRIWKNTCLYIRLNYFSVEQMTHIKNMIRPYKGKIWNYDLYDNFLTELENYIFENTICPRVDFVMFKREKRRKKYICFCSKFKGY